MEESEKLQDSTFEQNEAKKDFHMIKSSSSQNLLVGGFNPSEKYQSKWESSPNRVENQNIFETTTQSLFQLIKSVTCYCSKMMDRKNTLEC